MEGQDGNAKQGTLGHARREALATLFVSKGLVESPELAEQYAKQVISESGRSVQDEEVVKRQVCTEADRSDAAKVKSKFPILNAVELDSISISNFKDLLRYFVCPLGSWGSINRHLKLRDMTITLSHEAKENGDILFTVAASARNRAAKCIQTKLIMASTVLDENATLWDFVNLTTIGAVMRKILYSTNHQRRSTLLLIAQFITLLK